MIAHIPKYTQHVATTMELIYKLKIKKKIMQQQSKMKLYLSQQV
jgi:hypothetical protein